MNIDEPTALRPDHEPGALPDEASLHLVRRLTQRLGAPMHADVRDAQAARAAAVARGMADERGARGGRGTRADHSTRADRSERHDRSARGVVRRLGQRPLVPAGLVAAALAAVVVLRVTAAPDLPILALGGAGADADADARGGAESASMLADGQEPAILPWMPVEYVFVLDPGLTEPADRGAAWRLEPPADLAVEAARLAAVLGLPDPTPSEWDDASWSATDPATGASLWLGATGDWSYSGPQEPIDPACSLIEPRTADGSGAQDPAISGPAGDACPPPTPPVGVPDPARARELAAAFLDRIGLADVRLVDAQSDAWGAWVSGVVPIPGLAEDAGPWIGVALGGGGRVIGASGTLARPVPLGDYPLVGVEAAVDRLRELLGGGGASPTPLPADAATTEPAPLPDGPMPIDPPPGGAAPEQVTVALVRVELVTTMTWTVDGEVLLVPHFRFHDADGGTWDVVAVADRYLVR